MLGHPDRFGEVPDQNMQENNCYYLKESIVGLDKAMSQLESSVKYSSTGVLDHLFIDIEHRKAIVESFG